jgi:hypothetical protein
MCSGTIRLRVPVLAIPAHLRVRLEKSQNSAIVAFAIQKTTFYGVRSGASRCALPNRLQAVVPQLGNQTRTNTIFRISVAFHPREIDSRE